MKKGSKKGDTNSAAIGNVEEAPTKKETNAKKKSTSTADAKKEPIKNKEPKPPKEKKPTAPRKNAATAKKTTPSDPISNKNEYKFDLASYMNVMKKTAQSSTSEQAQMSTTTKPNLVMKSDHVQRQVSEPANVKNLIKFLSIMKNSNKQQSEEELKAIRLSELIELWQSDGDDFELFDMQQIDEEKVTTVDTPGWALGHGPADQQSKLKLLIDKFDRIYSSLTQDLVDNENEACSSSLKPNNSTMNSVINDTLEIIPSRNDIFKITYFSYFEDLIS